MPFPGEVAYKTHHDYMEKNFITSLSSRVGETSLRLKFANFQTQNALPCTISKLFLSVFFCSAINGHLPGAESTFSFPTLK